MSGNESVALILEDEPLIAMDVENTLVSAGFKVTTVTSTQQALDWLSMCRPDIAVVDIALSDGPCCAVVERLKQDEVPFIVHSGDEAGAHQGTPFGAGHWLGKPSDPQTLAETAKALMEDKVQAAQPPEPTDSSLFS